MCCSEELVAWVQAAVAGLNAAQTVPLLWQYTLKALRDTLQLGYFHPK